jgi:hypothetical protein
MWQDKLYSGAGTEHGSFCDVLEDNQSPEEKNGIQSHDKHENENVQNGGSLSVGSQ